jgi:hypothetical protein
VPRGKIISHTANERGIKPIPRKKFGHEMRPVTLVNSDRNFIG